MGTAILFSKTNVAVAQFPDAVRSVQDFFVQCGMEVGSPQAVRDLADGVQDSGFRRDLTAIIVALCADAPGISYLEILGVLLAAAAGQEGAAELPYLPALDEPVCHLFSFVTEARPSSPEKEQPVRHGCAHGSAVQEPVPFQVVPGEDQTVAAPLFEDDVERSAPDEERGARLARALALAADGESFGREPFTGELASTAEAGLQDASPTPQQVREMEAARRRVPMWAAGAGGIVLGSVLEFFVQRRPAVSPVVRTPRAAEQASVTKAGSTATEDLARVADLQRQFMVVLSEQSKAEREVRALAAETSAEAVPSVAEATAGSLSRPVQISPSAEQSKADQAAASPAVPASPGASGALRAGLGATPAVAEGRMDRGGERSLHSPVHGTANEPIAAPVRSPVVVVRSAGIMTANLISSPVPMYPPEASAARVQGEVVVAAVIGRNGSVIESRVVSGPPLLRNAALNAVQRWHYRPFEMAGKPVEIITTARVEFRLNGE